ncbi:MAG: sulfur carrier protein ThiS [Actinobacteria bacterium]|nr:sulfur carrier protein ThiS [Actinomycetota bacterium]
MIVVNGEPRSGAPTVGDLLSDLGLGADARGVAVAVDGEVVPRSQWGRCPLSDGARVEVVGAIQGG